MVIARRTRVLAGLALALAAVAVIATALRAWGRAEGLDRAPLGEAAEVVAEASLSSRVLLFGDTVQARIDVVLDKTRVDPGSVRIAADFGPFAIIRRSNPTRQDSGDTVVLRTTYALFCVAGDCVPSGQSEAYSFEPARISFAARGGTTAAASPVRARVPSIRVYSRFAAQSAPADRGPAPWQADVLSLPAVSYRLDRRLLVGLLLVGATLAALAGIRLADRVWPRRTAAPAPEPEPVPVRVLSPLEHALALLEQSIDVDGVPEQRRAIELVAEELEHAAWGDPNLARAARVLAWSEVAPDLGETSRLAARVRSSLPREAEDSADGNGYVE